MHGDRNGTGGRTGTVRNFALLFGSALLAGFGGHALGLTGGQAVATAVFLAIIAGTLLFWESRLAIAFLGLAVLVATRSLTIPHFVESAELPVILFLVGMMIVVGALRDLGFFTWVIQAILSIPRISGLKFIAVTAAASALLACVVDEVTSIIFIATLIFQVCGRLKLNPAPYIVICVLATNVGSAGTMMGNPVGIFIGTKAGLTFYDFMIWAFPVMLVALAATIALTLFWYRRELAVFDRALKDRLARNLSLTPKVDVPVRRGVLVLVMTLGLIALHHPAEQLLGLAKNSMLLIAPLISAGVIMLFRRDRARYYVEREIDWWTLLFFLLLFAIAGTLQQTQVTRVLADTVAHRIGTNPVVLIPSMIGLSAIGSAFVDNVIFVAAFAPVVEALGDVVAARPLWWALLFGGCFGGNITLIGSTANIVALGMLEKQSHVRIRFAEWVKIGALSALVSCAIAAAALLVLAPHMKEPPREHAPLPAGGPVEPGGPAAVE